MLVKLCSKRRQGFIIHAELEIKAEIPPVLIRLNDKTLYRYSHYNYGPGRLKQHHYIETDVFEVKLEVTNESKE